MDATIRRWTAAVESDDAAMTPPLYATRRRTAEVAEVAEDIMNRCQLDQASGLLLDAALDVHTALGPGVFESAYEACLARELQLRGARVARQVVVPIEYKGMRIDAGYRIDLLVNDCVVAELKSVSKLLPIHEAQLLSYLRLGKYPVGLLINFHATRLREGVKRMVNNF